MKTASIITLLVLVLAGCASPTSIEANPDSVPATSTSSSTAATTSTPTPSSTSTSSTTSSSTTEAPLPVPEPEPEPKEPFDKSQVSLLNPCPAEEIPHEFDLALDRNSTRQPINAISAIYDYSCITPEDLTVRGEDLGFEPIPEGESRVQPGYGWSGCTANYLYTIDPIPGVADRRYFFGTANHCITEDNPDGDGGECQELSEPHDYGTVTPEGHPNNIDTLVAHDVPSVYAMIPEAWRSDPRWVEWCRTADFGFYEVPPEAFDRIHPKTLVVGGPTHLEVAWNVPKGDQVIGYGSSLSRCLVQATSGYECYEAPGNTYLNVFDSTYQGRPDGAHGDLMWFRCSCTLHFGDSGGPHAYNGGALGLSRALTPLETYFSSTDGDPLPGVNLVCNCTVGGPQGAGQFDIALIYPNLLAYHLTTLPGIKLVTWDEYEGSPYPTRVP